MAFNRSERLALWTRILAEAEERLATVETRYPAADPALRAKITANEQDSVRTAQGFVKYYSE